MARTGRPDEARQLGVLAVDSGWMVPSNRWRATELAGALAHAGDVPEAGELRERLSR